VVPTNWLKLRLVGLRVRAGAGVGAVTPTTLSCALADAPVADVTVKRPVVVPATVGLAVTWKVVLSPACPAGAKEVAGEPRIVKTELLIRYWIPVIAPVPQLRRVKVPGALVVLTGTFAKLSVVMLRHWVARAAVPLTGTEKFPADVLIVSDPPMVPAALALKRMGRVTHVPAGTVKGRPAIRAAGKPVPLSKSPPVTPVGMTLLIVTAWVVLVLQTTMFCTALLVPTTRLFPKARLPETVTEGVTATPVPSSPTVIEVPLEGVRVSVPGFGPTFPAAGAKVTVKVAVAPAPMVAEAGETENGAPVVAAVTVTLAVPLFVMLVWAVVVPPATVLANVRLNGLAVRPVTAPPVVPVVVAPPPPAPTWAVIGMFTVPAEVTITAVALFAPAVAPARSVTETPKQLPEDTLPGLATPVKAAASAPVMVKLVSVAVPSGQMLAVRVALVNAGTKPKLRLAGVVTN